ncbi:acyltransferase family protein [Pelagicoccus albus]|uniref:Acyltransferase n=1 Tax=Pelagicoccus albus TaxID=415222 RepID=A0A7X1B9N2_9BACT|nr:acyltransferase [Pelagicoccus albus]MBC2608247.1 acyltransferase [Pelagicoccus albus]
METKKKPFLIPSLNGIRAISISIVFLAHAGASGVIPGGFGVTVFFFLSGFLITTLLRREFDKTGGISIRNFFIRRIFRILPPFYGALLFAILLSLTGLLPGETTLGGCLLIAGHIGNYAQIFWSHLSPPQGTGVYWSLAVEEHFYILFPLFALILFKKGDKRVTVLTFLIISALVLAWRIILVNQGVPENRTYMGTDTRVDSILFGSILAIAKNPALDPKLIINKWLGGTIVILAILALLFCFAYRTNEFRETYRYTIQGLALMPLFYTAVVYSDSVFFRWLNWKPVDYFGQLSYTFYLLHYVLIYAIAKNITDQPIANGVLALVLTTALSAASFHYFEKPLAKLRGKFR